MQDINHQGYPGTGKSGNLDVHFQRGKTRGVFLVREIQCTQKILHGVSGDLALVMGKIIEPNAFFHFRSVIVRLFILFSPKMFIFVNHICINGDTILRYIKFKANLQNSYW